MCMCTWTGKFVSLIKTRSPECKICVCEWEVGESLSRACTLSQSGFRGSLTALAPYRLPAHCCLLLSLLLLSTARSRSSSHSQCCAPQLWAQLLWRVSAPRWSVCITATGSGPSTMSGCLGFYYIDDLFYRILFCKDTWGIRGGVFVGKNCTESFYTCFSICWPKEGMVGFVSLSMKTHLAT